MHTPGDEPDPAPGRVPRASLSFLVKQPRGEGSRKREAAANCHSKCSTVVYKKLPPTVQLEARSAWPVDA